MLKCPSYRPGNEKFWKRQCSKCQISLLQRLCMLHYVIFRCVQVQITIFYGQWGNTSYHYYEIGSQVRQDSFEDLLTCISHENVRIFLNDNDIKLVKVTILSPVQINTFIVPVVQFFVVGNLGWFSQGCIQGHVWEGPNTSSRADSRTYVAFVGWWNPEDLKLPYRMERARFHKRHFWTWNEMH